MAVTFKGASASITGGTTSCTAVAPTGGSAPAADDIVLIVVESTDSTTAAGTPNTPGSFSKIFEETQGAGATGVTTLTVFAIRATGAIGDTTIDGVGNHCSAVMLVYSGAVTSGTAWTVGAGNGANSGNGTMTGLDTPSANCLVLMICGTTRDANNTATFSSWTNANLTDIAERADNTVSTGTGGGFGVAEGYKASAGATGDSTVTIAVSAQWRSVHVALEPAATPVTGTLSATLGAATTGGDADVPIASSATPTLGATTLSGDADVPLAASSTPTLGAVTLTGDADSIATGTAAPTLGAATLSGDAAVTTTINAVLSSTLGAATLAGEADAILTGTATPTLGAATLSGAATVPLPAALSSTLGAATLSSTAEVVSTGVSATLSSTLGAATLSSTAEVLSVATGTLSSMLGAATVSATATTGVVVADVTATAEVLLGPVVLYGSDQRWPWIITPGDTAETNLATFVITPGVP